MRKNFQYLERIHRHLETPFDRLSEPQHKVLRTVIPAWLDNLSQEQEIGFYLDELQSDDSHLYSALGVLVKTWEVAVAPFPAVRYRGVDFPKNKRMILGFGDGKNYSHILLPQAICNFGSGQIFTPTFSLVKSNQRAYSVLFFQDYFRSRPAELAKFLAKYFSFLL